MKYFVQFKTIDLAGRLTDALGSDGIFILDGRNELGTMVQDAYDRMEKLRFVKKYKFFEIHKGDLRHSRIIYTNYKGKDKKLWSI